MKFSIYIVLLRSWVVKERRRRKRMCLWKYFFFLRRERFKDV